MAPILCWLWWKSACSAAEYWTYYRTARGRFYHNVGLWPGIWEGTGDSGNLRGLIPMKILSPFITSDFDIVVEAASVNAVKTYAGLILCHNKDLVIMSVGALSDLALRDELRELAMKSGRKIHIPSGAIFGLDNLKIGRISKITRLLLRTTKNPASLGISTESRQLIFSGKSQRVYQSLPKKYQCFCSYESCGRTGYRCGALGWSIRGPQCSRTIHWRSFGETYIRVTNIPSPDMQQPATSLPIHSLSPR